MSSFARSSRAKDAPMDFEWTSRPSSTVKPVWAASSEEPVTPQKRNRDESNAVTPLNTPKFGVNQNIPFIFQDVPRQSQSPHAWTPPPSWSPSKLFHEEPKDVDMPDATPPKQTNDGAKQESARPVATGGMRRVYKARHKAGPSSLSVVRTRDHEGDESDESGDEEGLPVTPTPQNLSNHYTLNLPSPAVPQPETPYLLLGYLQFFFNSSLVLLFLYLLVQFILTVQRDVEHRISEYSMDVVQEIAMCAVQYKNNHCSKPIPAMVRQCSDWEICMSRDPTKVGRARIGAELIAEVVNSFIEPISWKTLAFVLSSLSFLTIFVNALLSLYRTRHRDSHSNNHQPTTPMVPNTPFPPQHFGGYLSPAPTPSWGRSWKRQESLDEIQTPTRRRRLDGGGSLKLR